MKNLSLKQFYTQTFPTDEMGSVIHPLATFKGLEKRINKGVNLYAYIFGNPHEYDSLVRERLFEKLAQLLNVDYSAIYDKWVNSSC